MYHASRMLVALLCCLMPLATFASSLNAQQSQPASADVEQGREATSSSDAPMRRMRRRGIAVPRKRKVSVTSTTQSQSVTPVRAISPVALINETPQPEYLFGQAEVTVKGNQDPIIRLGLAQNGSTVVEFPATDNFFAVHPGSSNVVAVDESPMLATDHYLVFRAGRDFISPSANSRKRTLPETTVSVQMQSGMFVTFMFYPVRNVTLMAHRCIVSYSRAEIVAARRAVGLAVNLDGKDPQAITPPASSTRLADEAATPSSDTNVTATNTQPRVAQPPASILLDSSSTSTAKRANRNRNRSTDMTVEAQRALQSALAAPGKFTNWSRSVHGLSLAVLTPVELNDRHRLAVVAIKNTSAAGVRLVAGQPVLDLETVDERKRTVQTQSIVNLFSQSTALGGAIPAGATVYYAIIYETPVLGATQRLRLSAAQIDAADEPATLSLTK